jgi:hypothetical protein
MQTWPIANILDDTTVSRAYGYAYPNLVKPAGLQIFNPNVPAGSGSVVPLGVQYVMYKGGANLQATFSTAASSLVIKAVEKGPASRRVLDVTPGVALQEPGFGSTYTEIDFAVINTDASNTAGFTFVSQGTAPGAVELKWDPTEPTGYLPLDIQDTVCVTFDGIQGARLDSVRVGLRRAGSMTGGVWRYSGTLRPSPLGAPLAVPITATINTTPSFPYPVPWPNWATVDLRSYSIDASSPFAVGFVCVGDPTTQPRVMTTEYPSTTPFHSFTFLNSASSPDWFFLTSNNAADSIYLYLIRAYVSVPTTSAPLPPVAAEFRLEQNYPNPFNPTTTIAFSLPYSVPEARLSVFDVLGREVWSQTLAGVQPGRHEVVWNGTTSLGRAVGSGLYFYRITAGTFSEVKRMVLVR